MQSGTHASNGHIEPSEPIRSILAINSRGLVTRANLPARRLFHDQSELEGRSLGWLFAQSLATQRAAHDQVIVSFQDGEGVKRLLLVLGEEQRQRQDLEPEAVETNASQRPAGAAIGDYIAHELRNNLSIILGLSQLTRLRTGAPAGAEDQAALDGIQAESEHALEILSGLLKLTETRTKDREEMTCVPLHSVVYGVVADHRRRYPQRRFTVQGDMPSFAEASSTWLTIALGNLISNAEKVTPIDDAIEVTLTTEGARSTIMVLDGGERLNSDLYRSLWNIYTDGPPSGVKVTGSGIGLSLCKELVTAMGGRVWAGPRAGRGSAFAISLCASTGPAMRSEAAV